MKAAAEVEREMYLYFDGTPVQVFPTCMGPIYADAWQTAVTISFRDDQRRTTTKVADKEHLILLALEAYRPKDRVRILQLGEAGYDRTALEALLERFDNEEKGYRRKLARTLDPDRGV